MTEPRTFGGELDRLVSARQQADAISTLTDQERRSLAVAGISEGLRARQSAQALTRTAKAQGKPGSAIAALSDYIVAKAAAMPTPDDAAAAALAAIPKPSAVVATRDAAAAKAKGTTARPLAQQSKKAAPAVLPIYNHAGELIGVTDPSRLIDIPAGSAVYDAQGNATGFVDDKGHVTVLADGVEAVQKAVTAMVERGTRVAKSLQARQAQRVAKGLAPSGRDALAVLTAIGQRVNMEAVVKSKDSNATTHPLIAAALLYDRATPAQQTIIRKALSKCTRESRHRATVALHNAVYDTVGPRR